MGSEAAELQAPGLASIQQETNERDRLAVRFSGPLMSSYKPWSLPNAVVADTTRVF